MKAMSPLAISLNFDSLNEAYGFPAGFRDVSFFEAFDRVAALAAKYGLPLSIYVIGKDLEHPEHAARVREWQQMGHEIGNHTWSHDASLGAQDAGVVREEILRGHEAIVRVTGVEPKGFIAPAWSTSRRVVAELLAMGYVYDTSVFPSVYLYPLLAKSLMSHSGNKTKTQRVFARGDWHLPMVSPLEPYYVDAEFRRYDAPGEGKLLILPLPAQQRWRAPSWHTAGFFFGWEKHYQAVRKLCAARDGFYYLIHPADFLAPEDLSAQHRQHLERMEVPLAEKMQRLEDVFRILSESGREKGTMLQKAQYIGRARAVSNF